MSFLRWESLSFMLVSRRNFVATDINARFVEVHATITDVEKAPEGKEG